MSAICDLVERVETSEVYCVFCKRLHEAEVRHSYCDFLFECQFTGGVASNDGAGWYVNHKPRPSKSTKKGNNTVDNNPGLPPEGEKE